MNMAVAKIQIEEVKHEQAQSRLLQIKRIYNYYEDIFIYEMPRRRERTLCTSRSAVRHMWTQCEAEIHVALHRAPKPKSSESKDYIASVHTRPTPPNKQTNKKWRKSCETKFSTRIHVLVPAVEQRRIRCDAQMSHGGNEKPTQRKI